MFDDEVNHGGADADNYRTVFEATGDGVIINDMDGNVVDVNPAFCRMHGYSRDEMLCLYPTQFIHPSYHRAFAEYIASLRQGRAYRTTALDLRKDGVAFPVEVNGTMFTYRGKQCVLGIVRDISERVQSEELAAERERQYQDIFAATSDAMMIVGLHGHIVEVNPAACELYGYPYEELVGLHVDALTDPSYHMDSVESLRHIERGESWRSRGLNVRKDGSTFHVEGRGTNFIYGGTRHTLAIVRDVTEEVQAYELLQQRVAERTKELSALLDVSRNVTSTLHLRPLLDLILDQLRIVVAYSGAAVLVLEGEEARIVGFRSPSGFGDPPQMRFPLSLQPSPLSLRNLPGPTIIGDVHEDSPLAREFREVLGDYLHTYYRFVRSWMAVPMIVQDRIIGYVHIAHDVPHFYEARHADLANAFAQQAAISIENARLYERAQDVAILEERQRLSRELHDSVSQVLYGIGLATRTAEALVDRDPARVPGVIQMIRSLAESGLTEMRALIFDLRPDALEREGLVTTLHMQARAVEARYAVTVTTTFGDEPDIQLPLKEALYRIAQEALYNAIKHAQPKRVEVRLERADGELLLEVRDDGKGFDTGGSFPGHLGLRSMSERAAQVGGTVVVESAVGAGTRVRVRVPYTT